MNIPSDIELVPVSEIIPYINNARTHSEAQVAQIAASIREFGFNNPILIDGDFTIIAGHGRYQAAMKLGMEKVPCIQLAHLTDGQRKAYILADNKLALNAGWDEELLKLELGELGDLTGLVGFSPEEINLLMDGWASDIEKMEGIEAKDTTAKEKIVISCEPDEYDLVREKVTNLIDSLGLENVIVS